MPTFDWHVHLQGVEFLNVPLLCSQVPATDCSCSVQSAQPHRAVPGTRVVVRVTVPNQMSPLHKTPAEAVVQVRVAALLAGLVLEGLLGRWNFVYSFWMEWVKS